MDFPLASTLSGVKSVVLTTIASSEKRRLKVVDISCKKSCSGCCRRYIELTVAEASIIVSFLKQKKLWDSVKEKAERASSMIKKVPSNAWFKMDIKCPVLDDNDLCSAYPVRPSACAVHYAKSDPIVCSPSKISNQKYNPVEFLEEFTESRKKLNSTLAGYGVLQIVLPLPTALLMADRISIKTGLSYDQVMSIIRNEI